MSNPINPINTVNSINPVNPMLNSKTLTYPEMLKSVKQAKKNHNDTFEYFLRSATGSGAYRLGRVIECRENVAGMTLIFICTALIKYCREFDEEEGDQDSLRTLLREHLTELKIMRRSVNVPLCVVPEEEGVMFPGEGMSLRFLNALIILESLLLARMTGDTSGLKENWSMYSPLDLVINLELPALLGVLDDAEKEEYAASMIEGAKVYERERGKAAGLVLAMRSRRKEKEGGDKSGMMAVFGFIFILFYTVIIIKLTK